jgi:hypothetical protein
MEIPTVRVHDPSKPGDYMVVSVADYQAGGYQLWDADQDGKPDRRSKAKVKAPDPAPGTLPF